MSDVSNLIREMGRKAKAAALKLAACPTSVKNAALIAMADALEKQSERLRIENEKDMAQARAEGLNAAMLDRLKLDPKRISAMAKGLRDVATLTDPVGEILKDWRRPNGLRIQKVRVPLGVVGIIYESRPNVTADSAGLCLKAGNACILRGGSEAIHSNRAIADVMSAAGKTSGLPDHSVQLVPTTDRAAVRELARLDQYLACIVPRGGEGLIRAVTESATVPVIKHYNGICHVFVDKAADAAMAEKIVINAKCQRPGVCNAMETLLVHRGIASDFLPRIAEALMDRKVELRMDTAALALIQRSGISNQKSKLLRLATEADWRTEYLDLILSVRMVDSLDQAIEHINTYGSAHSDSIVTRDETAARRFLTEVDSATVYHNASTRFTDGGEFGMGAEIGISTDRLHARGPMALEELTTYKYLIHGSGQVRE
ncbi:MAG: glutamate-5-semialdehyde dehydrogenase [Verrucomicrobia bacterium]|nr:glutamate-5-semialdehyde dehydrogenase [Verrucomicrobiota bacterium]